MREHSTGATREHGGQPAPLAPEPIVPHRVDTAVQPSQAPAPDPIRDPVIAEPDRTQLLTRDHTPLPLRKLPKCG
jgi:hypothetical protein